MEILLAIVVASAVIFFGALISMGNEKQRRAIDGLREQVTLWAMQDLRVKRERLAREARMDDPLGWLNKVVGNACGSNLNLQVVESFETPPVLICASRGDGRSVVITTLAPKEIRTLKRTNHNRLSQYSDRNPILSLPRNATALECSALNSGMFFDLELPAAWKELTGHDIANVQRLWIYIQIR